jgi:arabinosaccharide transport system permease protein
MATTSATLRSDARTRPTMWWVRHWSAQAVLYGLLLGCVVLTAMPFVYMISGGFKTNAEIFSYPITVWPRQPILINYQRLFNGESIPFPRQLFNSAVIALAQVALSLLVASLVGWGFAKYEFRGKRVLFLMVLATLMIPGQVTLVPTFLLMLNIGWLDTYWALILPGAVNAFGVFFLRQNMLSVPNELLDAGRIDGVSEFGLYWRIGLPLTRGALSILAVLTFQGAWNDYLWPLIVLRTPERFTFPLGLASLNGLYKVEYGMILAGATIVTIPVILIFIAGRNHLLDSLTLGAVKG